MMRGGTSMLGIVNFITFLASIPVLGGGIWLASRANSTDCIRFLQWPIIAIGLAVMVVSLMGFAGACYRQTWLLRIYLFAMFFVVVALLFFIVFAFAVTDRGEGQVVMNRRFLEYQLSDYNGWLRNRVADQQYWATIAACLRDGHACKGMRRGVRDPNTGMMVAESPAMFANRDLSPIEVLELLESGEISQERWQMPEEAVEDEFWDFDDLTDFEDDDDDDYDGESDSPSIPSSACSIHAND